MGIVASTRLYYNDCYLSAFDADVIEARDAGRTVFLDRTAFYPTSGGQPNDLGTIAEVRVVDVRDEDARVAHIMERPIAAGAVYCAIDWPRRYDHMQQHTGQHLVSAVCVELFAAPTLSFHMGNEVSTIELGTPALSQSQLAAIEDRANELTRQALPVNIGYSDADAADGLRKPTKRAGEIRIITIEGIDRSACGGTHVRSTAELGPILIRRSEKIRGNTRIEFVCGIRAAHRSRRDYAVLTDLGREFTSAIDDLPEKLSRLRMRTVDLEKERERLSAELGRYAGAQLHRETAADADGIRRVFVSVSALDEALRLKLQAFARQGSAIALAFATDSSGVLVISSPNAGVNCGVVLKEVLAAVGGRGGGSATLAQGALQSDYGLDQLKARLGFTSVQAQTPGKAARE